MSENNHLLDVLTREGVLINVSVRYWRATKKLNAEDIGLDPESVETRLISLGHKKLIPKESLQKFALIEGRAHALVEASTFPFLNGLGHFLPNARLQDTTSKLDQMEHEFMGEQEAFLGQYEATRALALAEWREAARRLAGDPEKLVTAIEEAFPCIERMGRAFGFTTTLFQIRMPEAMDMDEISAAHQQEVMRARDEAVREAAEKIHRGVEGFVSDCVASLREQTAVLCEEMLESMKSGKTGVHQKTLNRLVHFIEEFKTLNFMGDSQLEEQLEAVRREFLQRTAEEYRDNEFYRRRLQEGLRSLADRARDMAGKDSRELVEQFGQMGRRKFQIETPAPETSEETAAVHIEADEGQAPEPAGVNAEDAAPVGEEVLAGAMA